MPSFTIVVLAGNMRTIGYAPMRNELASNSPRRMAITGELRREIESGETLECRPVIMGILKDIEAGDVQAIVCQDFTRLSRNEDGIDGRVIRRVCRDNDCRIITPQYEGGFS